MSGQPPGVGVGNTGGGGIAAVRTDVLVAVDDIPGDEYDESHKNKAANKSLHRRFLTFGKIASTVGNLIVPCRTDTRSTFSDDTLDASWVTVRPDGPSISKHMVVRAEADVTRLVAELSAPGAADAYVTHSGRPAEPLPQLNGGDLTPVPDHVVYLAIQELWGYFAYIGPVDGEQPPPGDLVFPIGDPDSKSYVGYTSLTEFPAGTGLPIDTFDEVVKRFLTTQTLPSTVRWVAESSARAGNFEPLELAS